MHSLLYHLEFPGNHLKSVSLTICDAVLGFRLTSGNFWLATHNKLRKLSTFKVLIWYCNSGRTDGFDDIGEDDAIRDVVG